MKIENSCGVYKIYFPDNIFYIGMTTRKFKGRWRQHLNQLRNGTHPCKSLYQSFLNFGEDQILFEVILNMDNCTEQSILKKEKETWISYNNSGALIHNNEPSGCGSFARSDFFKKEQSNKTKERLFPSLKEKYKELDPIFTEDFKILYLLECSKCRSKFRNENIKKRRCEKCKQVSNSFDPKPSAIFKECGKCGENFKEKCFSCSKTKNFCDKETLFKLYIEDKLSSTDIANMFNVTSPTVRARLKEYNIEIRDRYKNVTDKTRRKIAKSRMDDKRMESGRL